MAQDQSVVDEIVAVVGGDIVLRSEVTGLTFSFVQQQGLTYSDDLWLEALNQIIDEKVIAIHAQRDTNLVVTDEQLEQALSDRLAVMERQIGGQARLEEIYGKSVVEIKAELREDFREQMLGEQLRSMKLRDIKVTPTEVKSWFDQYPTDSLPTLPEIVRVAHIVKYPAVSDAARLEAREVIEAIRERIVSGQRTIEEMATAFTMDPGSQDTGGRYEASKLNELVPEFAAVASRAPVGQISQIFETQFGLHILRVNARRGDVVDYNHILIAFDESKADPTEALADLTAIRDSILTEEMPFAMMARRHSDEKFTSIQGGRVTDPNSGDRDLFLERLGPTWIANLDTLEQGEISLPAQVELLDGRRAYHIVLLQKKVPAHRVSLETDYALIESYALREKQAMELQKWVTRLRKDVYIDIRAREADLLVQN